VLLTRLPSTDFSSRTRSFDTVLPTLTDYRRLDLHSIVVKIAILDVVGAAALSFAIFQCYLAPLNGNRDQLWPALGTFVVAWLLASQSQCLYQEETFLGGRRMLLRSVATCVVTFGIILALAFCFKLIGSVSRVWLLAWSVSTLAWVLLIRILWQRRLVYRLRSKRERLCLDRALVFAGSTDSARRVANAVEIESGYRVRVAASVPLPGLPGAPTFAWVEDVVRCGAIDRVVIADFEKAKDETNAVLVRLIRLAVDVTLMPNFDGLFTPVMHESRIGWMPAVDVVTRPLSAKQALAKRTEDLIVAGLAFLLTLPLMALISIAIKLDSPGPVLFRQKRAGFHETTFRVWKFRTMYHEMQDPGSVRQTSRDDSRVTRVGRILRRTSLDELPQLFNVLHGEMSIIGPRPHAMNMTAAGVPLREALDEYESRHRIKPGITGWAQVNGCRGEVDSEDKLRRRISLDCYYIENWSLALDAWIIARTVALIAFDSQAY